MTPGQAWSCGLCLECTTVVTDRMICAGCGRCVRCGHDFGCTSTFVRVPFVEMTDGVTVA